MSGSVIGDFPESIFPTIIDNSTDNNNDGLPEGYIFSNCHNICTNTIFPISNSGYTSA